MSDLVAAEVDYQRRTYLLLRIPGTGPDYVAAARRERRAAPRFALWLARLDRDDTRELWRRVAAVRLYDLARDSRDSDATCTIQQSELRPRDVDGDREVEIAVIAAAGAVPVGPTYHCGAVAFLVGGDDLNVQARFTREYRYEQSDAGGDVTHARDTTWRFRDVPVDGVADGHADLHVVERWTYRDDFSGDWDGEGTAPGHHERASDRAEVDCLYVAAEDVWRCPDTPHALGMALLIPPEKVLEPSVEGPLRPW